MGKLCSGFLGTRESEGSCSGPAALVSLQLAGHQALALCCILGPGCLRVSVTFRCSCPHTVSFRLQKLAMGNLQQGQFGLLERKALLSLLDHESAAQ